MKALIVLMLVALAQCQTQLYKFTFDSMGVLEAENEVGRADAISLVPDPVQKTNKVVRFDVKACDSTSGCGPCQRAELKVYKATWAASMMHEYTYATDLMIDSQWKFGGDRWITLLQHHDRPDQGEDYRHPILVLMLINNHWTVLWRYYAGSVGPSDDIWNSQWQGQIGAAPAGRWWEGDATNDRGKWIRWHFIVRWDWTSKGYLKVWKNSEQIVNYQGPIGYNDANGPTVKFGIYRSEAYTGKPYLGAYYDRLMYIDNYTIYDGAKWPVDPPTPGPVTSSSSKPPTPNPTSSSSSRPIPPPTSSTPPPVGPCCACCKQWCSSCFTTNDITKPNATVVTADSAGSTLVGVAAAIGSVVVVGAIFAGAWAYHRRKLAAAVGGGAPGVNVVELGPIGKNK